MIILVFYSYRVQ